MTKPLTWFQKEINKDKKEVEEAKKKFIKDEALIQLLPHW